MQPKTLAEHSMSMPLYSFVHGSASEQTRFRAFSSALRSVPSVAIWTDSPADSRPNQRFNPCGEGTTYPKAGSKLPDFGFAFLGFGTAQVTMLARAFGLQGCLAILARMDVERVIDEIEQLEEIFEAPDIRPLSASDVSAANRRHDETLANSPWFRMWRDFGVCCRMESPVLQLPEKRW